MFVVTVTFVIKNEYLDDFMAAMKMQAHNSLTREEGCLQFDVCRDENTPARIFLYEVYTDRAAFDAHLLSPHFLDFDRTVAPWTAAKTAEQWQRLEG